MNKHRIILHFCISSFYLSWTTSGTLWSLAEGFQSKLKLVKEVHLVKPRQRKLLVKTTKWHIFKNKGRVYSIAFHISRFFKFQLYYGWALEKYSTGLAFSGLCSRNTNSAWNWIMNGASLSRAVTQSDSKEESAGKRGLDWIWSVCVSVCVCTRKIGLSIHKL